MSVCAHRRAIFGHPWFDASAMSAAPLDLDLHKLGWRAFQDLVGVVLSEVLGQTFTVFADTNDVGQDGAFNGTWRTPTDSTEPELAAFARPGLTTVVQCKFSANPNQTLTPSALSAEIAKVEALVRRGECDAYIVVTNLRVTGATNATVKEQLRDVGVKHTLLLPGSWLCQQIQKRSTLRRLVPRVFGLGDLTSLLDERKQQQANALLAGMRNELATFVPTDAYRRASRALEEHRFVLLLGEPACGKSAIARTLSMVALDSWGCAVHRVDSPAELLAHWNPADPTQLFWVDDAFGPIRHDPAATDEWTRRMPQVKAAVDGGARVLMTSRDYIYRAARPRLKEYSFPLLREQQVVIDVEDLSEDEKSQILYHHLRAGDQPRAVLERWRPSLGDLAALEVKSREVVYDVYPSSGVSLGGDGDLLEG